MLCCPSYEPVVKKNEARVFPTLLSQWNAVAAAYGCCLIKYRYMGYGLVCRETSLHPYTLLLHQISSVFYNISVIINRCRDEIWCGRYATVLCTTDCPFDVLFSSPFVTCAYLLQLRKVAEVEEEEAEEEEAVVEWVASLPVVCPS